MGLGNWAIVGLALCQLVLAVGILIAVKRLRFLNHATNLRVSALQNAFQQIEEIYKLETRLAERRKRLENPSIELQEFLADLLESGCGIIRIQPDSIYIRGMRK
jgi:hypothetical protein